MKVLLFCLLLATVGLSEQFVEHGGRKVVSFDVPQVEYRGAREGKFTRTFFSSPVGNGNLKITCNSKGWMGPLKAEVRFKEDQTDKRRDQNTRLGESVEIPGALKTLTYSMSSPYVGRAIIVYTNDFRCELLVTGTKEARPEIDPTFERLLQTLKVVRKTKIGELQIGE